MRQNINLKVLCKILKAARTIIWKVENGNHYITDRMFLVKLSPILAAIKAINDAI